MIHYRIRPVRDRSAPRVEKQTVARLLGALVTAGLVLATVAGCAQGPARDRDMNAEAMQHMGYWGNDPGF